MKFSFGDAYNFAVSPFGGTMAWNFGGRINVRFLNGKEKQITADPDWGQFRQWLTEDRVIIDVANPVRFSYEEPFPAVESFYILDLTTGKAVKQTVQFADQFATYFIGMNHKWRAVPVYSPVSAGQAIYARHSSDGSEGLTLWDIPGGTALWSNTWNWPEEVNHVWADEFAWNRDGSLAAIVSNGNKQVIDPAHPELWLVANDGHSVRLTTLGQSIKDRYSIVRPTWSPDGKQIAFVLTSEQSFTEGTYTGVVAVVNVHTGQVTDYCIGPVQWVIQGLAWSPDSRELAFITPPNKLYVLNLLTGQDQVVDEIPNTNFPLVEGWIADTSNQ